MTRRYMLQPRPEVRIYRATDGTSIPNPLWLRDMLREGLSVTLAPPAGREPWRQEKRADAILAEIARTGISPEQSEAGIQRFCDWLQDKYEQDIAKLPSSRVGLDKTAPNATAHWLGQALWRDGVRDKLLLRMHRPAKEPK